MIGSLRTVVVGVRSSRMGRGRRSTVGNKSSQVPGRGISRSEFSSFEAYSLRHEVAQTANEARGCLDQSERSCARRSGINEACQQARAGEPSSKAASDIKRVLVRRIARS
jgi:hypothetical protein